MGLNGSYILFLIFMNIIRMICYFFAGGLLFLDTGNRLDIHLLGLDDSLFHYDRSLFDLNPADSSQGLDQSCAHPHTC